MSGDEPTPESKYDVTYQYRANVTTYLYGDAYVTIYDEDFLRGEPIDVTYYYKMPRKDIIVMNADGSVELVRGKADADNPIVPDTPSGAIRLAEVFQKWITPPEVNNSVRSIQEQIDELYKKIHELEGRINGDQI